MKTEGHDLWEGILHFSPLWVERKILKLKCHPLWQHKEDNSTFMKLLEFVVSADEEGEGEQVYEEQTNHGPAPAAPLVFADSTLICGGGWPWPLGPGASVLIRVCKLHKMSQVIVKMYKIALRHEIKSLMT